MQFVIVSIGRDRQPEQGPRSRVARVVSNKCDISIHLPVSFYYGRIFLSMQKRWIFPALALFAGKGGTFSGTAGKMTKAGPELCYFARKGCRNLDKSLDKYRRKKI
jgi:hypothetical protein